MSKRLTQIAFEFSPVEEKSGIPVPEPVMIAEPMKLEEPVIAAEPVKIEEPEKPAPVTADKPRTGRGRRSLKESSLAAELVQVPDDEVLFQKQYYSIGEVAVMFRENQSLIRYWETEFDILQPRKNRKGDRFFRPVDIKNLVLIHDLLRRRKFTIEGAKEYLKKNKKVEEKFAMVQSLERIKAFLLELKASL